MQLATTSLAIQNKKIILNKFKKITIKIYRSTGI